MFIHAYGLFWRADEINWHPGKGKRDEFGLWGRIGKNRPSARIADFRNQKGIYILYGNLGPYYVGLTRKRGLGNRLKDHLSDKHKGNWDRFSWFGFCRVLKRNIDGVQQLGALPKSKYFGLSGVIGDVEAMLIKSMAVDNSADMKFKSAKEWHQIKLDEYARYFDED